MRQLAVMEMVDDGVVMPLSNLILADGATKGSFDGGVLRADGTVCELGEQVKASYSNITSGDVSHAAAVLSGKHLFAGMLQTSHFGHFLIESLGRLWATQEIRDVKSIVFYARHPGARVPRYAEQLFALLGLSIPIHLVEEPTRVSALVVPSQLGRPGSGILWGFDRNRRLVAPLRAIAPGPARKVYVSRSKLNPRDGGFLGERAIESALEQEGYSIVHPQELSLAEQYAIYNGAEKLIFADGSAIHAYALVAREDQKCFVVWRRKRSELFHQQVRSFGGQGLLGQPSLLESWVPQVGFGAMARSRAVVDMLDLHRQLHDSGFIRDRAWKQLDIGFRKAEIESLKSITGLDYRLDPG